MVLWRSARIGDKAHVGVDKDWGLIHAVVSRAAKHDLPPASEVLDGGEDVVYGDASRTGGTKGDGEEESGVSYCHESWATSRRSNYRMV